MNPIRTYLFDLMQVLTSPLPKQTVFSTTQATKYTNDGLQTTILHIPSGQLYKVVITETNIKDELGHINQKDIGHV